MTEKFNKWFFQYGFMKDWWKDMQTWQFKKVKRIAYRAYKRGQKERYTKKDLIRFGERLAEIYDMRYTDLEQDFKEWRESRCNQ